MNFFLQQSTSDRTVSTTFLVGGFILLAALSRILPHPTNFTPMGAMALLGAATIGSRALAIAFPLIAFWISDLVLNNLFYASYYDGFAWFTPGFVWMYGAMVLTSLIGFMLLSNVRPTRIAGAALLSSTSFFLITNFGVWLGSPLYPQTVQGLMASYIAGIPFFQNALLGDLFYSAVLFSAFGWLANRDLVMLPVRSRDL